MRGFCAIIEAEDAATAGRRRFDLRFPRGRQPEVSFLFARGIGKGKEKRKALSPVAVLPLWVGSWEYLSACSALRGRSLRCRSAADLSRSSALSLRSLLLCKPPISFPMRRGKTDIRPSILQTMARSRIPSMPASPIIRRMYRGSLLRARGASALTAGCRQRQITRTAAGAEKNFPDAYKDSHPAAEILLRGCAIENQSLEVW